MHPPVYAGNTPRLVPRNVDGHSMSGHVSCSVILHFIVVLTCAQMHIYLGDRAPHALSLRQVQTGRCDLFRFRGRAVWALPCDPKALFT